MCSSLTCKTQSIWSIFDYKDCNWKRYIELNKVITMFNVHHIVKSQLKLG